VDDAELFVSRKINRDRVLVAITKDGTRTIVKSGSGQALRNEASVLERLGSSAHPGFIAPQLLDVRSDDGRVALVITYLAPVDRRELDDDEVVGVAVALAGVGVTHGDFSPWNVVRIASGVGLFDWEYAVDGLRPGYDLAHYVVQTATFRASASARASAQQLQRLTELYADALGMRHGDARTGVLDYLDHPGEPWQGFPRGDRVRASIKAALARPFARD
jgi:hypothetical protein